MLEKEGVNGNRIPSGCAVSAIFSRSGKLRSGEDIIKSIKLMHERSNGLGGGFAGYGIYPEFKDYYAFHIFYDSNAAREACEHYLDDCFHIKYCSVLPTRPTESIKDSPIIWRYFIQPYEAILNSLEVDEKEYVARCVTYINMKIEGAFVFSSGKNMGVFKAVGYPEDVGNFYRLDEYKGYCWTAHGRYPTNTPGWWGGAHPFSLLDLSVVHNGEISSYDANRRCIEMFGYKCSLLTDTEAIAYMLDYLTRKQGLTFTEAANVIAAPFWEEIERMDPEEKERMTFLRNAYANMLITGPFSIIVGFDKGIMALNDRLKLRSMVIAEKDDTVYIASEESAIRVIEPNIDSIRSPMGGEPVIYTLDEQAAKLF